MPAPPLAIRERHAVAALLLLLLALPACSHPQGSVTIPPTEQVVSVAPTAPQPASISCQTEGPIWTAEPNVYGGDAVAQIRSDGQFEVVIDDRIAPCLHVGLGSDGSRIGTVLGDCPPLRPDGYDAAHNAYESYLARSWKDERGSSHIMLGFVTYEFPKAAFGVAHPGEAKLVEHRLIPPPGGPGGGESSPALVALGPGDSGFLVAWVEENWVRLQPIFHGAQPAGPSFDVVLDDASTLGRPSLAWHNGHGVLAFTARTPDGYDAFAVPIVCNKR